VVAEVPMEARYGEEESNLRAARMVAPFLVRHLRNLGKRIFYSYYLRNFNIASIEILAGVAFLVFGVWFGASQWIEGYRANVPATSGTVMVAALPVIVGVQLVLAFLSYDLQNVPREILHRRLEPAPSKR